MANTKKKSNGKKTNSSSKSKSAGTSKSSAQKSAATRKRNAEMAQRRKKVVTEVYLWIFVAVALLLFLSNFGVCGIVGNALKNVMLGMFGSMGYVFPIALFVLVGLIAYNSVSVKSVAKITADIVFFIDGCLWFYLFTYEGDIKNVIDFYKVGATGTASGGLTGGFFGELLHSLIGMTGAYIVAVLMFIVSLVMFTEKSLMGFITKRSQRAYQTIKEDSQTRREENEPEEQRRLEARRKTEGLEWAKTTIEPVKDRKLRRRDNTQDVHEIHSEITTENTTVTTPEIHIEGVDDGFNHNMKQHPVTYTYESTGGSRQIKIDGLDNPAKADEHAADGEFRPKERIIVSEEAKTAMKRKPYGIQGAGISDIEQELMGSTEETVRRASSEGKIIVPVKKKLKYKKPPYTLLKENPGSIGGTTKADLMQTANKLKQVLANFGVNVEVTNVSKDRQLQDMNYSRNLEQR